MPEAQICSGCSRIICHSDELKARQVGRSFALSKGREVSRKLDLVRAPAILFLVSWSTFCLANGGGYGSGVSIQGNPTAGEIGHNKFTPVNLQRIEMQTEALQIDLFDETATVQVRYDFFNPGGPTTIVAAFPCVALKSEDDLEPNKAKSATFTDFVIAADNKPLTCTIKGGDAPKAEGIQEQLDITIPKWYTFRLDFSPKQHRVLTVSYRAPYGKYVETVSDDEHVYPNTLTYLFSTAAIWAGPIKKGHVVIHAKSVKPDEVKIRGGKPGRFQQTTKDSWTWDFADFKPTFSDDIAIETTPEINVYPSISGKGAARVEGGEYMQTGDRWQFELTDFKVTASSALAGGKYRAQNVNKWSETEYVEPDSCWAEGVAGNGEGEWLELSVAVPVLLDTLQITNGLVASDKLFHANNRIKKLDLSVNSGESVAVELPDQMKPFDIKLPESRDVLRTIRLTIREVYPGTKYQDTCVTRIRLFRNVPQAPEITPAR